MFVLKPFVLSIGKFHSVLLNNDGEIYTVGNGHIRLGTGKSSSLQPEKLSCEEEIVKVSTFADHTLALSSDGELYGFGCNRFKQLHSKSQDGVNSLVKLATVFNSRLFIKLETFLSDLMTIKFRWIVSLN